MCLITEQKEPEIIDQDLVVYKIVKTDLDKKTNKRVAWPVYYKMGGFRYTEGELNKTEMIKKSGDNNISYFDGMVGDHLAEKYKIAPNFPGALEQLVRIGVIAAIGQGFHFGTTRRRFCVTDPNLSISRFIVPAGSEVYFDETGLGVSNQIIYSPEL